jgi:hypothetical protein
MRKAILISSAMMVLAAVIFAGNNDPWKSKPYQQWDDKDVRKILGDSPWSKIIQVDATWTNLKDIPAADSSQLPSGPSTAPAAGGKIGTSPSAGANPTVGGAAAPPSDPGDPKPQVAFAVRWVSSRTLQRAAARSAELAGQIKPDEAEKQLANPPDVYEIALTGPDMRPFQTADEDTLMKRPAKNPKRKFRRPRFRSIAAPTARKSRRSPSFSRRRLATASLLYRKTKRVSILFAMLTAQKFT